MTDQKRKDPRYILLQWYLKNDPKKIEELRPLSFYGAWPKFWEALKKDYERR